MTLTNYAIKILVLTLNLFEKKHLTAAVKTFTSLCIHSLLLLWINAIRLEKCKRTINIEEHNGFVAFSSTLSSQLLYPSCGKIVNLKTASNFLGVSQNNFISGTEVDSVDEYVLVLYSNGIFILYFLSLERTVCSSIRLMSLSSVK